MDRADAQVTLGYANLNKYLASQLGGRAAVSAAGDKLKLTGTLPFPPRSRCRRMPTIDVAASAITLRPASSTVLSSIPWWAAGVVEKFFTVKLPISQLPFGYQPEERDGGAGRGSDRRFGDGPDVSRPQQLG